MNLTYLHISDLHLTGNPNGPEDWAAAQFNQDLVTSSMIAAIEKLIQKEQQSFDLIFITGDLAKRGKKEEYEVVQVFCERLLEATKVPSERLFIVPGNHDVNREEVKKKHRKWFYSFESQDEVIECVQDAEDITMIMEKFRDYYKFAANLNAKFYPSKNTYFFAETVFLQLDGDPVAINLVGLNSALFAGYDGDDKQKLFLGLPQISGAIDKLNAQASLSIALFHHPFACFHSDDAVCRNQLMHKVDLILTGHLHEPENIFERRAGGEALIIGAGASFETRESENSFNVVKIDLATGSGAVQFFKYLAKHNRWKKNTDVNPDDDRGIFHFTIDSLKLKDPADEALPEIHPESALAAVILEVKREIDHCIRRVESIAVCKQIHDCLHEVLQVVIRPMWEEVLSVWEETGDLSKSRINVVIRCVNIAAEQRGMIKGERKSIVKERRPLRRAVDGVLTVVKQWMDGVKDLDWSADLPLSGSWPSRGHFAEDLDKLTGLVEFAFSEADDSMTAEESALREGYLTLRKALKQARKQSNLSSDDQQRLDDELKRVESNRERLKNSLAMHHSWQEAHNEMHKLDSFRETSRFSTELDLYCLTGLPKLLALVEKERARDNFHHAAIAEPNRGNDAPAVPKARASRTAKVPVACNMFIDDMQRLKASIEDLQQNDSDRAAVFDKMRKPFDDAFYCVDKRSLQEVNSAERRAVALREWLDELAAGPRK